MKDLFWWIWAPFGWTLALFWMLMVVLVGVPSSLFFPFRTWWPWARPMMGQAFIWSTLTIPRIQYDPSFDRELRAIYVQNHVSALDAFVACSVILHGFCGLENAAHYHVPIYGWVMRLAHGIKVPKAREGRYESIAAQAAERKKMGISILAFPEGHRTVTGKMRPFRSGVFRMAREIGYPIIPIASKGLFEVMPKGTGLLRRRPVTFTVGPVFETAGLNDDELQKLMEDVQGWIADHNGDNDA